MLLRVGTTSFYYVVERLMRLVPRIAYWKENGDRAIELGSLSEVDDRLKFLNKEYDNCCLPYFGCC